MASYYKNGCRYKESELIPCISCMHVNRKVDEEWERGPQQTYQFTQGFNILHRLPQREKNDIRTIL